MKEKKKGNYLTIKESRAILKYNIKQMKYYEGFKKRNLQPSAMPPCGVGVGKE